VEKANIPVVIADIGRSSATSLILPLSFIASRKPFVRAFPLLRASEIVTNPAGPWSQWCSLSAAASATPVSYAPFSLSELIKETYLPETAANHQGTTRPW
jgi:hypothetical protein